MQVIAQDGREILLVGTAHVSRESADLVRELIEQERPDRVCIELDAQRYEALTQRRRWEELDLREVIRKRQLAPLIANLVLAAYQKKLGGALGVVPGTELVEAARAAEAHGIPVVLCDRDVRVTLRRVWASLSLWKKSMLLATLGSERCSTGPSSTRTPLRRLREQDVLSELMRELGEALPGAQDRADRRARHLPRAARSSTPVASASSRWSAPATSPGIRRALEARRPVDLEELSRIPPVSPPLEGDRLGRAGAGARRDRARRPARGRARGRSERAVLDRLRRASRRSIGAALSLAHPAVVLSAFVRRAVHGAAPADRRGPRAGVPAGLAGAARRCASSRPSPTTRARCAAGGATGCCASSSSSC